MRDIRLFILPFPESRQASLPPGWTRHPGDASLMRHRRKAPPKRTARHPQIGLGSGVEGRGRALAPTRFPGAGLASWERILPDCDGFAGHRGNPRPWNASVASAMPMWRPQHCQRRASNCAWRVAQTIGIADRRASNCCLPSRSPLPRGLPLTAKFNYAGNQLPGFRWPVVFLQFVRARFVRRCRSHVPPPSPGGLATSAVIYDRIGFRHWLRPDVRLDDPRWLGFAAGRASQEYGGASMPARARNHT